MNECYRCSGIFEYLKRTENQRAPSLSYDRIKGNLEEIYKASGCEKRELICNPLKKLEEEKPQ
jgi:hypothetical protein